MSRRNRGRVYSLPAYQQERPASLGDLHLDAVRRHDTDSNIERMVREADAEAAREPVKPEELHMQPVFWHVLIEPARASVKIGSGVLYRSDESARVEEILTTIGRIVAIGPTAFTGQTPAGNKLGEGIDRETVVGRWVMYAKHTGQEIKLRSGHVLKLMDDSEILAFVDDPEKFKHWL